MEIMQNPMFWVFVGMVVFAIGITLFTRALLRASEAEKQERQSHQHPDQAHQTA